jgi:hypothetical protein
MDIPFKLVFQRFGRTRQLRIRDARDLAGILYLDEAHWVATSAPISTIRCDCAFLTMMDDDNDNRVRSSELKKAIRWLLDHMKNTDGINNRSVDIKLEDIHQEASDGQRIAAAIRKMLALQGKELSGSLSLPEVLKIKTNIEDRPVSEVGVVLPEATDDESVGCFISDILVTIGGIPHPSGKHGVGKEQLSDFTSKARAQLDWRAQGRLAQGESTSAILPLGDMTEQAYATLEALRHKIDEYFAQCEALSQDKRWAVCMPPGEERLNSTDFSKPEEIQALLQDTPLATPRAERILNCLDNINPHYAAQLNQLMTLVLFPLLGEGVENINEDQWKQVKDYFSKYEDWLARRPTDCFGSINDETLNEYLDGEYEKKVNELIAHRQETALQMDNVRLVERILRLQAYIMDLVNNFVSFPHLYDPKQRAMFEMGSLVMDGRRFNMAVKVEDRKEHSKVAKSSDIFVLYVEITPGEGDTAFEVAVPVTSGGKGNLVVGKRGIFQDVEGKEWNARVVHIIENPISLREAAVAPFKRIGSLITGKIEQITTTAEKKLDKTTQTTLGKIEGAAASKAATPAPQQSSMASRGLMAGGLLAGGGVAIAAVSSAVINVTKAIEANPIIILAGIGGAILAVLLPSLALAYAKLRRRDLSAILEGSGWAINTRMRLSRAQSRFFTQRPRYKKYESPKSS